LAAVVRDEPDAESPHDAAGGIPDEETPPLHPCDPCHPRAGDAEPAEEARQEDGLSAVTFEEPLARRKQAIGNSCEPRPAIQESPSDLATEPVADVVADDRGGRCDDDH